VITDDQIEELGASYFHESVTVSSWDERDNILEEGCSDNPGLLLVLQVNSRLKIVKNRILMNNFEFVKIGCSLSVTKRFRNSRREKNPEDFTWRLFVSATGKPVSYSFSSSNIFLI
jgi:hypothetical protein